MNDSFMMSTKILLQVSALDLIGKVRKLRSNAAYRVTRFIRAFAKAFSRLHCKDRIYPEIIGEDSQPDTKVRNTTAAESSGDAHLEDYSALVFKNDSISSSRSSSRQYCEQICLNTLTPVEVAEEEADAGALPAHDAESDISSDEAPNTRDLNLEGDWQIPLPSTHNHKATSCSDLRKQLSQLGMDDASSSTTHLDERYLSPETPAESQNVTLPMIEKAGHKILNFLRTAPCRAKLKALLKVCVLPHLAAFKIR